MPLDPNFAPPGFIAVENIDIPGNVPVCSQCDYYSAECYKKTSWKTPFNGIFRPDKTSCHFKKVKK